MKEISYRWNGFGLAQAFNWLCFLRGLLVVGVRCVTCNRVTNYKYYLQDFCIPQQEYSQIFTTSTEISITLIKNLIRWESEQYFYEGLLNFEESDRCCQVV